MTGAACATGLSFGEQPKASGEPLFEEIPASASGIRFVHENAMSEARHLPESLGPGAAFFDYDNDGWMDIYIVNSGASSFWTPGKPIRNALYKNNRDGTFTDVTEKAGVSGGNFGMGVSIGDYDNDGWPDIFVTSFGNCLLYRNNRDGTFSDVTQKAGVASPGWTTSAVWFDYDNDGRLDLFVCSYVVYLHSEKGRCGINSIGRRFYCTPQLFNGTTSFLYHNNGDGTFTRADQGTEIAKSIGKGLGVVATDVNNDGRMDLFVSNDTMQNFLFLNRGPGAKGPWNWEEASFKADVAFGETGQARSGMGVDAGDLNGDGNEDLFVANLDNQYYSLYLNNGNETFRDAAAAQGIAKATRLLSGWGLKFFDYDNDGAVDLLIANGHPDDMISQTEPQVSYKEPPLLFHQGPDGKLENVSAAAGPAFQNSYSARGLAIGDYDNDGAVDVLLCENGGAPVLLKNRAAAGNHWLGLRLEGVACNRDAVGARIVWTAAGVRRQTRKNAGGSFLSSHDPRLVLGIGKATAISEVEIHWPSPSKRVEVLKDPPIDRYLHIREGLGIVG